MKMRNDKVSEEERKELVRLFKEIIEFLKEDEKE